MINPKPGTEEYEMAKIIWETSKNDEGTISATGANVIAHVLAEAGFGRIATQPPQETTPVPEEHVLIAFARELLGPLFTAGNVPHHVKQFRREFVLAPEGSLGMPQPWEIGPGKIMEIPPKTIDYDELESFVHTWELHDHGPSHFSRGLHILAHLKRGGTLEEYGTP